MGVHGELHELATNLWGLDGFAALGPGVQFPVRATVARQGDGSVMIYSPIAMSQETAAAIEKLGPVTQLVSPNLYHHLFLREAKQRFPDAKVVGADGLRKKVDASLIDETYSRESPAVLGDDFEQVFVAGAPKMDELVVLHRPSGTLLVGDYFFNIHETKGWLAPLVVQLVSGGRGKPLQSKLWKLLAKDRAAMKHSAQRLVELDYERIVPCHGRVIEEGPDFTRRAVSWLLA